MSKRRRRIIFALCVLTVFVSIWLDHGLIRSTWRRQPKSEEQARPYDFAKYHDKICTVINVVDGDTLDIDFPDGQDNYTRIRLWGIDTPETKNPQTGVMYFGPQAAEFTTKMTLGKQITVYLDEGNRTRGYYGRLLAYIQLPDRRFLNEVLLTEGYAYADTRFHHSFYYKYQQAQASARRQQKGLWHNVTREQLPHWLQNKRPELLLETK